MADITQEELNERVAILHKFKDLLEQQRSKFQEYLTDLEKQQDSITSESTEKLIAHTELEQQIVKNLVNLQKVIVPMNKMYIAAGKKNTTEDAAIENIQNELSVLQSKVMKQNEINRDLLRVHIENIRTQINTLKNPYKTNRSVYAQKQAVAQYVQVEA